MDTIEDLKQEARSIQNKIARIEEAERATKNKALLGKTFKYRNSYSCPEKPSDYWWLYLRVIKIEKDGNLRCIEFQTDKHGDIFIKPNRYQYGHLNDHKEITLKEWNAARSALKKRILSVI